MSVKKQVGVPIFDVQDKSETAPLFYSNKIQIASSYYDINIDFSVVRSSKDSKMSAEKVATIAMSPQHAKDFLLAIKSSIESYEDEYGVIPPRPTEKTK